ncbi:MAG TPA: carbonic anhydrase [Xanthomonadales bacterium]|nr:carbonic anhydrase [Xanthomonadales bacterium]
MKRRLSASQALQKLKLGNRRFVTGHGGHKGHVGPPQGDGSIRQQHPIAIVLGCSDSRVPAEMVFDLGFGDLFVIRVAGNIVAPSQIASVEFAASRFGVRLALVLGHTECGAVQATIDEIQKESPEKDGSLRSIVDRVRPAVENLLSNRTGIDQETLIRDAVRANIHASVSQLSHGSQVIRHLIENGELQVNGAEYSLDTGEVEFFD